MKRTLTIHHNEAATEFLSGRSLLFPCSTRPPPCPLPLPPDLESCTRLVNSVTGPRTEPFSSPRETSHTTWEPESRHVQETVSLRRMPPASELAAGALPQPRLAGQPQPQQPSWTCVRPRWEMRTPRDGLPTPSPSGTPHPPAMAHPHLPGPEQRLTSGQAGL